MPITHKAEAAKDPAAQEVEETKVPAPHNAEAAKDPAAQEVKETNAPTSHKAEDPAAQEETKELSWLLKTFAKEIEGHISVNDNIELMVDDDTKEDT